MKVKKCKLCGGDNHTSLYCFKNKRSPLLKNKGYMRRIGKHGKQWLAVRAEWFEQNEAEFYYCYIDGERLTKKETTLDHILSRGRRPDLRYELSNLAPCCWFHNQDKGSLSLEEYLEKLSKV